MEAASNGLDIANAGVSFAVIIGREVVGEVSKFTDNSLIEVSELLVGKRVAVESCWVGASFQECSDLVVLEPVVIVGIVEASRLWRGDAGYVGEGIGWRRFFVGVSSVGGGLSIG